MSRYQNEDAPDYFNFHGRAKAVVLGAKENSNNIGDNIVHELYARHGVIAIGDDCAMTDEGERPPGGNIPNDDVAEKFGYSRGSKGRYQRYEAPSAQQFARWDADSLVISLGATYKDHFSELREGTIEKIIRANLTLPLEAARLYVQAALRSDHVRHEQARENGMVSSFDRYRTIVFIGSYAHRHPFTNGTLYCAAKAGLNMAAQSLAWELTDRNFRIHIVHPFHVNGTPMWSQVEQDVMKSKDMTWEEADAYNRKDLKMPDLLRPEEVAEVVVQLIHGGAMSWVTGPIEMYGGSR